MPLHDSLGSSQVVRLPKMNSIPTTEDLKYALAEANKNKGLKTIELPFRNPNIQENFIVKLALGQQKTAAPTWTLQRGDGVGAKVLWTKSSADVLMIQSKIKIDSQYAGDSASQPTMEMDMPGGEEGDGSKRARKTTAQFSTGQQEPIILGGSSQSTTGPIILGSAPAPDRSLSSPSIPSPAPRITQEMAAQGPAPATLDAFFSQDYPPPLDAFLSSQAPASVVPVTPPVVSEAKAPPKRKTDVLTVPLPPPIKFDKAVLNEVHNQLSVPATGLMSFPAFVFFLFREFVRYQQHQTPVAAVILEVAMRKGGAVAALPPQAVPVVGKLMRTVCSPLDIPAHLSGGEFGVLLPALDGAKSLDFAVNLHEALTGERIFQAPDESALIAIGVAAIPDTCKHPEVLMAAARQAKDMTKGKAQPYLLFPAAQS
jgi:hypothetical protein